MTTALSKAALQQGWRGDSPDRKKSTSLLCPSRADLLLVVGFSDFDDTSVYRLVWRRGTRVKPSCLLAPIRRIADSSMSQRRTGRARQRPACLDEADGE